MKNKKRSIIWPYVNKHIVAYTLGLLTLLMVDYVNLYIPQLTGEITDGLASFSLDLRGLLRLVMLLLLAAGVITIGRFLWRFFIFGTSRKIENEIRKDMFEKLETLSQNYFNTHKTGDLMTHFTNDLEALRNSIGPAIISAFDAIVMTLMVLYKMMVYVNLKLTLLTLIPMSMIAIGGYYFGEAFEKRFAKKQEAFAKLSDHVQESVTGERVIKAFVQEEKQAKAFEKINTYNKQKNMHVVQLMATFMPLMDFVIGISFAIALIYGGYLAMISEITLGKFVAFNSYIGMLIWPMIAMGDAITCFSQGRAAIARINHVFAEIPEIVDANETLDVQDLNGAIDIHNLTFSYGKDYQPAIKNLDLHIEQGETLAILGRTGDGKTTLVNLLLRLYDTSEGEILFDGHDIKQIPLKVLRSHIAYVPQDSYLFSDTIQNNIRFGKVEASLSEVEDVAKLACVHDNIVDFPLGYDTVVGERGVTLSGGQKQRCAIARALLKEAPILILDDALSAVDTDTEDKILENLKNRSPRQTTIMIAHRISTVKNADHILILDEGQKIEYGTFDELMALGGVFKEMHDKQQLEKQLSHE